jgi:hypothetical protein
MFTSFEKNDCPSDTIMFGDNSQGKVHYVRKSNRRQIKDQPLNAHLLSSKGRHTRIQVHIPGAEKG